MQYNIFHHISGNPEVKINKVHRSLPSWENDELKDEATKWSENIAGKYRHKENDIGAFSGERNHGFYFPPFESLTLSLYNIHWRPTKKALPGAT